MAYDGMLVLSESRSLERLIRTLPIYREASTLLPQDRRAIYELRDAVESVTKLIGDTLKTEDAHLIAVLRTRATEQLKLFQEVVINTSARGLLEAVDAAHISALGDQLAGKIQN